MSDKFQSLMGAGIFSNEPRKRWFRLLQAGFNPSWVPAFFLTFRLETTFGITRIGFNPSWVPAFFLTSYQGCANAPLPSVSIPHGCRHFF